MQYFTLNTDVQIPVIGLGTWQSPRHKVGEAAAYAITECGYRHIDCAAIYNNEKEIGEAFKKVFASGQVRREEVFVTSKLWNSHHRPEDVETACRQTLADLQLDYLDLYLMHWGVASSRGAWEDPVDENGILVMDKVSVRETWQAMENLVSNGLVRAIGAANFTGPMLVDLLTYAKIQPAMNQIELHPYLQQQRLVDFCHYKSIAVTAYSPLGTPANARASGDGLILLDDPQALNIARMHNKTPAQIVLRWGIQRGTVVIPKSVTPANIKNNIEVFDFELSPEEIKTLKALDRHHRFVDPYGWWQVPYFE